MITFVNMLMGYVFSLERGLMSGEDKIDSSSKAVAKITRSVFSRLKALVTLTFVSLLVPENVILNQTMRLTSLPLISSWNQFLFQCMHINAMLSAVPNNHECV